MEANEKITAVRVEANDVLDAIEDIFNSGMVQIAFWSMQGLIKVHVPALNDYDWKWSACKLSNGGSFIAPSTATPNETTIVNSDSRFSAENVSLELVGIYLTLTLLNELSNALYQSDAEESSEYLTQRFRQLKQYAMQRQDWTSISSEF